MNPEPKRKSIVTLEFREEVSKFLRIPKDSEFGVWKSSQVSQEVNKEMKNSCPCL